MLDFKSYEVSEHNTHYAGSYSPQEYRWIAANAKSKAANIMTLLASDAENAKSVLEVGCGAGIVLNELSKISAATQLVGVDMEDPENHPSDGRPANVQVMKYDGQRLPFDDKSFDLVYATHVLEHVPDERGFLSEISRVSKGLIYLEVPCELHIRSNQDTIQSTLDIGHINFYTPDSFLVTLETSGLKVIRTDVFDFSTEVYRLKASPIKAAISAALRKSLMKLDKRLAAKVFCFHCGALCRPA